MKMNKSGFTLIELLIVIGIIAILVAMLMPSGEADESAKAVRAEKEAKMIYTAALQWRMRKGQNSFDGVSIDELVAEKVVPEGSVENGVMKDPWDGDYSIQPVNDGRALEISMTNVSEAACRQLVARVKKYALAVNPDSEDGCSQGANTIAITYGSE